MKTKRKIYAILMTAVMILTLMPAMAFAEGETPAQPVKAYFSGAPEGTVGGYELKGMYANGSTIDVFYSDSGETPDKVYEYGEYEYIDEVGEKQVIPGFLEKGADEADFSKYASVYIDYDHFDSLQEGANEVPLIINVPTGEDENGYINYAEFTQTLHIWCGVDTPIDVKFIPAEGFEIKGNIGYNNFDERAFYGEGNKFVVTVQYTDDPEFVTPSVGQIEAEYMYYKSEDGSIEGFYDNGNPDYDRFDLPEENECYLEKGINKDVEFTYYAYVDGQDDPISLPFAVDINAEKYGVYAIGAIATFTGSAIKKPKFTVYTTDDEIIPASEYTYKLPSFKSIGWHTLRVTIKDKFKDKYDVDSFTVRYGIGPTTPKVAGITIGKNKLTAKWKKMTAKQLKNIDGIYVVLATDRQFSNITKKIWVSKTNFKAGKSVIKNLKNLKKGKTYYVKVYSYKKIKQNGKTVKMPSADSKVLAVKIG
ncbi:MAG: hypothetical protein IJG48_05430 [Mogibacterium sp.]|nr:hypothetical protein [Mogibacterium sp.]